MSFESNISANLVFELRTPGLGNCAYGKFNSSPPRQNGCHFLADIFKSILLNKNIKISIQFSLKFNPKGLIDNKSALVQVMAWHQAISWTNADPVHQRMYAALGVDELS